jgi:uncharacterized protein DUF4249
MNRLRIKVLIISSFILTNCSEEAEISPGNFVVEGFIVANEKVGNIKIKSISPIVSEGVTSTPIPDALITMTDGSNYFPLTYNTSSGLYEYTDDDLLIENNEEYSLEIIVNDRTATSTTIVPNPPTGLTIPRDYLIVPQLSLNLNLRNQIITLFQEERITLEWDPRDGQSYFVVIENRVNEIDPILPEGIPEEATNLLSSFRFISAPSEQTSFEIIAVALETYGSHVAKVYSVNPEYVDLYENVEQDSRDLNEPPSNISNALGIFTAFAVDSVEFEVRRQ